MIDAPWRKRFSIVRNRLYLYPAPEPFPHTRIFWLATGLVALLALLFSGFFIIFLTSQHNAYLTHAEDLGIMDQALWNTLHGQVLHQSICDIVYDTNCYSFSGISRFAIHFEPILFPISLFYLVIPDPRFLQVLQVLVVASGAFPAFWLARLRLRNEWAGVAIAALYLLYPAQQWATVFDFHAVTLTAALLLFVLYFMYTRRTVWLFVFAILAMGCKEEIPVVVALFALWSIVFQRRWRSGLALLLLAIAWTGIGLLVVHLNSPTGHSLLAPRYDFLKGGSLQITHNVLHLLSHPRLLIDQYVLEHSHFFYLRTLVAPTGYLALLAPWVLILALPTLALNLLSSDPQMYSGLFQYDAEMVPVLIFATIEALVLLLWLVQVVIARLRVRKEQLVGNASSAVFSRAGRPGQVAHFGLLVLLLGFIMVSVVHADHDRGTMPFSVGFKWPPTSSAHVALAQHFIDMIPPTASVSAQSSLVPHISHRTSIYMFPYADTIADYIFLDVTSEPYPYVNTYDYIMEAKNLLLTKNYGVVAAQDGYMLLKRGLPSPGISPDSLVQPNGSLGNVYVVPSLSNNFCSYVAVAPQTVTHPLQVTFTDKDHPPDSIDLVGFDVDAPNPFSLSGNSLTVTTYWKVAAPIPDPLQVAAFIIDKNGHEHLGTTDFPAVIWCQTQTWKPGMVLRLTSRLFNVQASHIPYGLAHVSIALVPLIPSSSTMTDVLYRLKVHIVDAPRTVSATQGTYIVQLMPITAVP